MTNMKHIHHYFKIILAISFLISFSQLADSFAHEDEGDKQRDDRIHMTLTNDSSNPRTGVTFYYTSIAHAGHDHPWIGDSGVIICEMGLMNPGQSKTCHGPFHSAKSPDQKPECNPTSDWNFSFLVSYNEGGNQKSIPLQRGSITGVTSDNGESRNFRWSSHTDQVFSDENCPSPEKEEPPPLVAPNPPDPPTISVFNSEGDDPTISGTGDEGTEIHIFISEIGFFGFDFFWSEIVTVDENGKWVTKLNGPLENGVYDIVVVSVDVETGLISEPAWNPFVVDRDPPEKPDATCLVGVPEPKKDVVAIPFTPMPRINGTSDLDPDLSRPDKGGFDCALIAVANNLNYFVNSQNIPRGSNPGQLPLNDSAIIEQLRIDMKWGAKGVTDSNFLSGKNTFVNRYDLPITTSFTVFPTPEQIEEALDQGKAIELNFQFKKKGQILGHTVTVVGIEQTADGVSIQIHDPMTKGGKTQDSYEIRSAQDRSGNSFWILMNYPNWDGYTILEGMFVQSYGTTTSDTSLIPDSSTSRGTILEPSTFTFIPPWIKNNADWWSSGLISDKEFANGIGYMVKEKIIQVENMDFDSQGKLVISDNLQIPDWIKNNARWWSSGTITDDDFKSGIQFMLQENIISFKESQQKAIDSISSESRNSSVDLETKEKILQHDAVALLANNAALRHLLEMQNFVAMALDDLTEETWIEYSENKNQETMQHAIELEETTRVIKQESLKTVTSLAKSNENIELFFKEVKENGFDDFKLKNNAEEKIGNLSDSSKIKTDKDLNDAEKITKTLDGIVENSIANAKQLGGINNGEIPVIGDSQSSRYSLSFNEGSINDMPSTEFGIDSLSWAKTCTQNSECNASLGESCSKRGDAEGRCIPTWFGICHDWKPSCIVDTYQEYIESSTDEQSLPEESSDTSQNSSKTYTATVLVLEGAQFPISQFTIWQWLGECDDAWHYHTQTGNAVNINLKGKADPDPNNCGFGKVNEIQKKIIQITQEQRDSFIEYTDINPLGNEPIYGGSGP